jgi:hypothetical protein
MSAEAESSVFRPRGSVNTGTGHQFNGTVFIVDSSQRLVRVGRDPRTVEREHLDWLNQRFVEPEHYGRARELLAGNGGVLLTGAPPRRYSCTECPTRRARSGSYRTILSIPRMNRC